MKVDDKIIDTRIAALRRRGREYCEDLRVTLAELAERFDDPNTRPSVDMLIGSSRLQGLQEIAVELRTLVNLRRGGES